MKKPWGLETDNSGQDTCALVLRALIETGSHFTDSFRLDASWGRGVSLFLRVHVPEGSEDALRKKLGRGFELKTPPQPKVNGL